jgi:primosomal protein N''
MQKSGFDPEALVSMFASAGAKQSAQVKEAVTRATLAALQGRELTLKNIREALKNVSQAASTGMAKNPASSIDVEKLLNDAVTGMDQALLKAVEANQRALQQFVDQGADLKEKHLKKAIDDLDKFEDMLFGAIKTAAGTAGGKLAAPWEQVLERMKAGGTMSGTQASATVEQMAAQMQTAMRGTRTAGLRAAQALAESYTALVSGVLIGMSDALRQGSAAKPARKNA